MREIVDFLSILDYRVLALFKTSQQLILKSFYAAVEDKYNNKFILLLYKYYGEWYMQDILYGHRRHRFKEIYFIQKYIQHFLKFIRRDYVLLLPPFIIGYNTSNLNIPEEEMKIPKQLEQFKSG